MQVDLYDIDLKADVNRRRKQIVTRKFCLNPNYADLTGIDSYFSNALELKRFKAFLKNLIDNGRTYEHIGDADCDNMFLLEAMNLGDSAKSFSIIVDFSNCLDLVLAEAFGCRLEDIRKIDNYDEVSRSILNYDFENIPDVTFASLIEASEQIEKVFTTLSRKCQEQNMLYSDRLYWVVFNFYQKILETVGKLKSYVMVKVSKDLSVMSGSKVVYRSMNYSTAVATGDVLFNEMVTLHYKDKDIPDYDIAFRSYKTFEYLGEEIRYGTSRGIQRKWNNVLV